MGVAGRMVYVAKRKMATFAFGVSAALELDSGRTLGAALHSPLNGIIKVSPQIPSGGPTQGNPEGPLHPYVKIVIRIIRVR